MLAGHPGARSFSSFQRPCSLIEKLEKLGADWRLRRYTLRAGVSIILDVTTIRRYAHDRGVRMG